MSGHLNPAALARQYELTAYCVRKNADGLSNEEGLSAPERGGNSLNWVVGHVLASRNEFFPLVGLEPFWDEERMKLYERGSPNVTDAAAAVPLEELLRDLGRSQEALQGYLKRATPEDLERRLPEPSELLGETVGQALTVLSFHEAYHAGQTGILRRRLGKEGVLK
ncbi:MAG: DinB family protein [Planctomycetota bacterium]|nr:DinB family protein [Planctomycetota bacterium]